MGHYYRTIPTDCKWWVSECLDQYYVYETVDYLERSNFDIHDVTGVVQKAIVSFDDSIMGSSYLTERMEKYL